MLVGVTFIFNYKSTKGPRFEIQLAEPKAKPKAEPKAEHPSDTPSKLQHSLGALVEDL